jgi:hypothetical protein
MAQFYPSDFSVLSQAGANMAQNQLRNGETMANIGKSAVDIMSNVMDTKQKADSSAEALIQLGMMKPEEALTMSPAQIIGKQQAVLQKNALADMVIGQQAKAFQLQQQQQQAQRDNAFLQGLIATPDSKLDATGVQAKKLAITTGDLGTVRTFLSNSAASDIAAKHKQDQAILESGLKQQREVAKEESKERTSILAQNGYVPNPTASERAGALELRRKMFSPQDETFAKSAEIVMDKVEKIRALVKEYGNVIFPGSSPNAATIGQLKEELAVIYSKLLDPGSVVREPEVERFLKKIINTDITTRPSVTLSLLDELDNSVMKAASIYPIGLFSSVFQEMIKGRSQKENPSKTDNKTAANGRVMTLSTGKNAFIPSDGSNPYEVE